MSSAATRVRARRGLSLVEVMIAVVILAIAVLGLAGAAGWAAAQLHRSRLDLNAWAVLQAQVDSLSSVDYDKLADGSTVVSGYPLEWSVSGTNPKKLVLEVQSNLRGQVRSDTLVLYFSDPDAPKN